MIRISAIPAAPSKRKELGLFTSTISGLALVCICIQWARIFAF